MALVEVFNGLKVYLKVLQRRQLSAIAVAFVLAKLSGAVTIIATRHLLPSSDFGALSAALAVFNVANCFIGLGLHHGFLRYGSIAKNQKEKEQLYYYVLLWGSLGTLVLMVLVYLFTPMLVLRSTLGQYLLYLLVFRLLGLFCLEFVKTHFRIHQRNTFFAWVDIAFYLLSLFFSLIMAYYYGVFGFVIAQALVPLFMGFSLLLSSVNNRLKIKEKFDEFPVQKTVFWRYSLFIGLSSFMDQMLYSLDIILLEKLLTGSFVQNQIAAFKMATLIPLNILFVPSILFRTDYVYLAHKQKQKHYLISYLKNYFRLALLFSIILLFFCFIFQNIIFNLLKIESAAIFYILLFGSIVAVFLRLPLSHLSNILGWGRLNLIVSSSALIFHLGVSFYAISNYGLLGAAWSTFFVYVFSSFLFCFLFYLNFRKI